MTSPHVHPSRAFSGTRLWAMARKEFLQLRRDKRSLALAFLLPLVMLVLFGYAITTDVQNIQAAVVDRDHTPESRQFIETFARSGYFTIVETPDAQAALDDMIDQGTIRVGLVVPERFSADLRAGRVAPVELLLDGSDAKTANVARGYADAIARTFSENASVQVRGTPPLTAETRVWYNETLDSASMIVPGLIAVIMSIIAAMLTSLTIAREWERGTMEQLAATPVSRIEVILGKLVPYLGIGLIDVAIALGVALLVFDVPFRGSLVVFALAATLFLIGVLGLGIFISSTLKSQLLATQAALFATYMPALLFSGFMYTISNMPVVLQLVSRVVPARYFVSISRGLFLKGVGLDVLWPALVGLALYALATVTFSVKQFKRSSPDMPALNDTMPRDRFSFARLWQMVRKEVKQMWRDPKARPLLFASPILQMFLMGYAATTDVNHISTIVADHDRTVESRALVNAFTTTGYFQVVGRTDRAEDVSAALNEGRATVGLTIPPGFARDLVAGRATVQAVIDGADASLATVAKSYAGQIAKEFGVRVASRQQPGGVELRSRAWFNPSFESRFFNVPAIMGVQIFMIALLLTALGVVREREIGTLDQLLVSPILPTEFMLGKTIPVLGLSMVHLVIYTVLTVWAFGVPFLGSFLVLGLAAFIYALAGLGLGLFISTVSKTQQEAFMLLILMFLPAVMLSGFVSPVESMPQVFQWLTYANPVRYFLEIVRGVFLKGTGLSVLWPQYAVLTLMAVGSLFFATTRFRRMVA